MNKWRLTEVLGAVVDDVVAHDRCRIGSPPALDTWIVLHRHPQGDRGWPQGLDASSDILDNIDELEEDRVVL